MDSKLILVLCVSISLSQSTSAQSIGAINGLAGSALAAEELVFGANAYGAGLGAFGAAPSGYGAVSYGAAPGYGANVAPSSGGGFAVTSFSPITPTGITVVSENTIEGPVSISGQLPFLGAIAVEGALASSGAGAINYGCGNGAVGILSEGIAPAMAPASYPTGPALGASGLAGGLGYSGLAGPRPLNGLSQGAGLGYRGVY